MQRRRIFTPCLGLLLILGLTPGCGDDKQPAAINPGGQQPGGQQPDPLARKVVVLSTDYMTGGLSVVDLDTRTAEVNLESISSDPSGRIRGGKVYVVNRSKADNIQIIDPATNYKTERQFSTGNDTNPQDVAFGNDNKMYVPLYGSANLGMFDPTSGNPVGTVDLSSFADGDGIPEMATATLVGRRVFVSLQKLANFNPTGPGTIVVIDADSNDVVDADPNTAGTQGITLAGHNPNTVRSIGTDLFVSSSGAFAKADTGGLERVSTDAPYSVSWIVDENRLGGDASSFATNDGDTFFIVLTIPNAMGSSTSLVRYRKSSNELRELYKTDDFSLAGVAVTSKNEVIVADRTMTKPGIRIFNGETGDQVTTDPINVGLPPFSVLSFDERAAVLE